MTRFESLTSPGHLYTRAEVLSKPSPVPSIPGVYAWFFKEISGIVPTDESVTKKDFHVIRGAHWMVISLFLAVTGCGGDSGLSVGGGGGGATTTTTVATTSVAVSDDFFNPASIQVSPGVMVTWTWSSNRVHNVTFADDAITDSGDQGGGMYQTAMPTASGLYTYQCTIHPGMNGSVTVQ